MMNRSRKRRVMRRTSSSSMHRERSSSCSDLFIIRCRWLFTSPGSNFSKP